METRRRVAFVLSAAVVAVFLGLMVRIVTTPSMSLLYSGLDSTAASGVVEALERQGVRHEVRGDAIYVPADERDRVRITLAGEGLPTAGAAGYELLDGLSGFGTTSEMFDAAYVRAKEGELARTILAFSRVVRARVHIANVERRPFERAIEPTASVTVSTTGGPLGRTQAESIRYLVASAIGGLALTNVAVIDQEHGVVLRSGDDEAKSAGDDASAKAENLRRSVLRLLEARVGPGAAVVEVSVETTSDSETVRERRIDPESKVIIHKDTEESADTAEGEASAVTVASNLADGDVGGGDQSSRQAERTRERVNYEVSELLRESVRPAGEIRRMTVAVMVDGVRTIADDGAMEWTPRPEPELAALRTLVQSAVGYDESRGDVVTIETLQFSAVAEVGEVAEAGLGQMLSANAASLIQILALGAVAALLGLFVLRPMLSGAMAGGGGEGGRLALAGPDGASGPLPALEMGATDMGGGGEDFQPLGGMGDFGGADGGMGMGGGMAMGDDMGDFGLPAEFGGPISGLGGGGGGDEQRELLEVAIANNTEKAMRLLSNWLDIPEEEVAS